MTQTNKRLDEILAELHKKIGGSEITPLPLEKFRQAQVDDYNKTEGNLNTFDGYNCDICKNKGMIAKLDENGDEIHYHCKCHRIRDIFRRAKGSGLGEILTGCTFDKYETPEDWQKDLKSLAQEFCKDDQAQFFFIGGQVGAGKTHLCTAISAHYLKAGFNVQYMIWVEDAKQLKALVNDHIEYQKKLNRFKNADVLYIDDFLKTKKGEEPSNGDINLAFELLNRRYMDRDKITIISSEKTMGDLLKYDEATMSRIFQLAGQYKKNIKPDIDKNYRLKNIDYET